MSSIPKKIWGLWLDFNNSKDGILNDDLTYFSNRIKNLHDDKWEVNIITQWSNLLELIGDNIVLNDMLRNKFIGGAHKADFIRFFLLNEYGGIWIDISTFLVTSFNYLLSDPTVTFICYYAPVIDVAEWLINPLGELYEDIPYGERIIEWVNEKNDPIQLKEKYKKFNFITENYFICSTKNHPIIKKTYDQLTQFWLGKNEKIKSKDDLCFYQNIYINELSDEIFYINYDSFKSNVDKLIIKKFKNKQLNRYYLNKLWECGYLFNYLQLYLSIYNYTNDNKYEIQKKETHTTISNPKFKKYYENICINNYCSDIIINITHTDSTKETIKLLSASYNRFGKWSDTRNERLSWENTYLGGLLSSINSKENAVSMLDIFKNENFLQFKFGAYTRNSPIIKILKQWYPVNSSGGAVLIKNKIKTRKARNIRKLTRRRR